jgi:hypothetical protein
MVRLFLGLCTASLIAWPGATEPSQGLQSDREVASIQLAEAKVWCWSRGCRTIVLPAGCRWVDPGGVGRGNRIKRVCDRKAA